MLLGRLWIYQASAVPSTLHQKVKFIINDEVITVPTDTDVITLIGQKILGVRNLQAPNTFTSYQFEVIHTKKEANPPKFNMMARMKFNADKGLGKHS